MTELPEYDDGLTQYAPRAAQAWGHGPVFTTRRHPQPSARAWCYECAKWVGPDRTADPQALRLVEDDAICHAHAMGALCGACEACRPDGAIRQGELRRETEAQWHHHTQGIA